MRPLLVCLPVACLCAAAFAAAPPAKVPAEWLKLIDQLGHDDLAARKQAEKKLAEQGEDVLPPLRPACRRHKDPDVRLRASLLVAAMEKSLYGLARGFPAHATGAIAFV